MRRFTVRLTIALITFGLSVFAALQYYRQMPGHPPPAAPPPLPSLPAMPPPPPPEVPLPPAPSTEAAPICLFETPSGEIVREPEPELPRRVRRELDGRIPGWRFPEVNPAIGCYLREHGSPDTHPLFVTGDFDGDGQADFALLVEGDAPPPDADPVGLRELFVFLRRGGTFEFHRLAEPGEYIALIEKGEKGYDYATGKNFTYQRDAIFSGYFEKGGTSFVYAKGKFRQFVTSD